MGRCCDHRRARAAKTIVLGPGTLGKRAAIAKKNEVMGVVNQAQYVIQSLTSGAAHLAERTGGKPQHSASSSGWRDDGSDHWTPLGDCIGWVEEDHLYLEPTAAYRVAQKMARDTGEPLAISDQTLKKRLRDKGLLASVEQNRGTLTIRRNIGGISKDVLHLWRTTLLPEGPVEEDEVGE